MNLIPGRCYKLLFPDRIISRGKFVGDGDGGMIFEVPPGSGQRINIIEKGIKVGDRVPCNDASDDAP